MKYKVVLGAIALTMFSTVSSYAVGRRTDRCVRQRSAKSCCEVQPVCPTSCGPSIQECQVESYPAASETAPAATEVVPIKPSEVEPEKNNNGGKKGGIGQSPRTWKNSEGTKEVEARFVSVSGNRVVFERSDGKLCKAAITDLCQEDQAVVKSIQESNSKLVSTK